MKEFDWKYYLKQKKLADHKLFEGTPLNNNVFLNGYLLVREMILQVIS